MSATTALYRYFDSDGLLLYVGISKNPIHRLGQHRQDKTWWTAIASITIEHFATRAGAVDAERTAIFMESPIHNVVHNCGGKSVTYVGRQTSHRALQAMAYDHRVKTLVQLADAVHDAHEHDPDFCANRYWYGRHLDPGIKDAVCELVGWSALRWGRDHWMRSMEAYGAVYDEAYGRLPDCHPDCSCVGPGHGEELRALLRAIPSGGSIADLFEPVAVDPPDYDLAGSVDALEEMFADRVEVR